MSAQAPPSSTSPPPPPPPPPMPTGPLGQYLKPVSSGSTAAKTYKQSFIEWAIAYEAFNFTELGHQLTTQTAVTKVTFYADDGQQKRELFQWGETWDKVTEGVIVVEDLNMEWLLAFNEEFKIDQKFFRAHARFSPAQEQGELHIDCQCRANIATGQSLVAAPRARLSCRALRPGLYIVLLSIAQSAQLPRAREYRVTLAPSCNDAPMELNVDALDANAFVDYHDQFGAFQLQPFMRTIIDHLLVDLQQTGFLAHFKWNIQKQGPLSHKLKDSGGADSAMCWMLALSIWRANLSAIEKDIESLSYRAVVHPTRVVFNQLAAVRRSIAEVRAQIANRKARVTSYALQAFDNSVQNDQNMVPAVSLRKKILAAELFESLDKKMTDMKEALTDSTQFLIGSLTVNDAEMSLKQANEANNMARRATALTVLAAIYLPLSFVTSIFGMNLAELDPVPQWWAAMIALAVVFPPTAAFVAFSLRPRKSSDLPGGSSETDASPSGGSKSQEKAKSQAVPWRIWHRGRTPETNYAPGGSV